MTTEKSKAPTTEIAKTQPLDAAVYEQVGDESLATTDGGGGPRVPWVGFFGNKTKKNRESLTGAGIEPNQFYLFDNEPLKIKPFTFHLLKARRFFTQVDDDGNVTGVILTRPTDQQYQVEKYREYIMAQVLVITKDPVGKINLVPATWGARSALAKVFTTAIDFTKPGGKAADAKGWAARGIPHAISANARWAGGRFVVSAYGTEEKTLDGKNKYNQGHASILPTTAEGVAAFNDITSGVNLQTKLAPANSAWEARCKALEKKVVR